MPPITEAQRARRRELWHLNNGAEKQRLKRQAKKEEKEREEREKQRIAQEKLERRRALARARQRKFQERLKQKREQEQAAAMATNNNNSRNENESFTGNVNDLPASGPTQRPAMLRPIPEVAAMATNDDNNNNNNNSRNENESFTGNTAGGFQTPLPTSRMPPPTPSSQAKLEKLKEEDDEVIAKQMQLFVDLQKRQEEERKRALELQTNLAKLFIEHRQKANQPYKNDLVEESKLEREQKRQEAEHRREMERMESARKLKEVDIEHIKAKTEYTKLHQVPELKNDRTESYLPPKVGNNQSSSPQRADNGPHTKQDESDGLSNVSLSHYDEEDGEKHDPTTPEVFEPLEDLYVDATRNLFGEMDGMTNNRGNSNANSQRKKPPVQVDSNDEEVFILDEDKTSSHSNANGQHKPPPVHVDSNDEEVFIIDDDKTSSFSNANGQRKPPPAYVEGEEVVLLDEDKNSSRSNENGQHKPPPAYIEDIDAKIIDENNNHGRPTANTSQYTEVQSTQLQLLQTVTKPNDQSTASDEKNRDQSFTKPDDGKAVSKDDDNDGNNKMNGTPKVADGEKDDGQLKPKPSTTMTKASPIELKDEESVLFDGNDKINQDTVANSDKKDNGELGEKKKKILNPERLELVNRQWKYHYGTGKISVSHDDDSNEIDGNVDGPPDEDLLADWKALGKTKFKKKLTEECVRNKDKKELLDILVLAKDKQVLESVNKPVLAALLQQTKGSGFVISPSTNKDGLRVELETCIEEFQKLRQSKKPCLKKSDSSHRTQRRQVQIVVENNEIWELPKAEVEKYDRTPWEIQPHWKDWDKNDTVPTNVNYVILALKWIVKATNGRFTKDLTKDVVKKYLAEKRVDEIIQILFVALSFGLVDKLARNVLFSVVRGIWLFDLFFKLPDRSLGDMSVVIEYETLDENLNVVERRETPIDPEVNHEELVRLEEYYQNENGKPYARVTRVIDPKLDYEDLVELVQRRLAYWRYYSTNDPSLREFKIDTRTDWSSISVAEFKQRFTFENIRNRDVVLLFPILCQVVDRPDRPLSELSRQTLLGLAKLCRAEAQPKYSENLEKEDYLDYVEEYTRSLMTGLESE